MARASLIFTASPCWATSLKPQEWYKYTATSLNVPVVRLIAGTPEVIATSISAVMSKRPAPTPRWSRSTATARTGVPGSSHGPSSSPGKTLSHATSTGAPARSAITPRSPPSHPTPPEPRVARLLKGCFERRPVLAGPIGWLVEHSLDEGPVVSERRPNVQPQVRDTPNSPTRVEVSREVAPR